MTDRPRLFSSFEGKQTVSFGLFQIAAAFIFNGCCWSRFQNRLKQSAFLTELFAHLTSRLAPIFGLFLVKPGRVNHSLELVFGIWF
jgi:hypothetical protein